VNNLGHALNEYSIARQVHLVDMAGEHVVLEDHEYEELTRFPKLLAPFTVALTRARAEELVAARLPTRS